MNEHKSKNERFYNKLKNERFNRGKMFDFSLLSEDEMINVILSQSKELKVSYEIYQEILISIQDKNFKRFTFILEKYYLHCNNLMKKSLKTFKKYLDYIENSLNFKYNNGIIEGINRKIKTLKRNAYGYKSFYHFRTRILINSKIAPANKHWNY